MEAWERPWRDHFEGLRRDAEACFTVESWKAELDRQRETDKLLERVDGLVGRVAGLRLAPDRDGLVRRLAQLSRSDVGRFVKLTDASALIPDEVITGQASVADARPDVRSRGAALTVMHGMGVAIGWGTAVASRTTTEVGRFQIR